MSADLVSWASAQVQPLLPGLEGDSLAAAVRYSLSLSPDDTDRHWRSLLGSSPHVDAFLNLLREKRSPQTKANFQQKPLSATPPRMHTPPVPTRTPSPSKVLRITSKPTKRGTSKMTSDLLPKPKTKPAPMAAAIQENRPMTELEEIDSAIQALSQPTPKRFHCGCFGTRHEVYPLAPNCLHCGRVTCIAEGMGPCFFCGEELVSQEIREGVVRELRHERGIAKTRAANEKVRKVRAGERRERVWASKVGGQEVVVRSAPMTPSTSRASTPDSALLEAERRRDELLEFDRTFAERTRIIDQQAEFTPYVTIHDSFSTAQERAGAVRRLQQMEAEVAAAERAKRTRVLDIDFTRGKASVRRAQTEDLIELAPEDVVEVSGGEDRPRGGRVEIANGFEKPTFVES